MPYTRKQCRYFGAHPDKAPKDWKEHCTRAETRKAERKKNKRLKR